MSALGANLRLFVAVDLGAALRTAVADAVAHGRSVAPRAKWVDADAAHVTLAFLGRVEAARVPAIGDALAVAASGVGPFAIALADAGTFGRPASPRVLWLGIDGDVTSFTALQAAIAGALAGLGFAPEDRAFHPHITLARARDPRGDRDLARARAALDRPDAPSITVDDVVLFESRLAPSGARYTPLLRAALAGVPPTR